MTDTERGIFKEVIDLPEMKSAADLAFQAGIKDRRAGLPYGNPHCDLGMQLAYRRGFYSEQPPEAAPQPNEDRNSIAQAVQARVVATHNEGFNDGLRGTTPKNALHQRMTYENALEQELYWRGYESGHLIRESSRAQG